MSTVFCIAQPDINPHSTVGWPNAAFDDITNTEVVPNCRNVNWLRLEGEGHVTRGNGTAGELRQVGSKIVRECIGETIKLRIIREISEWYNNDREPGCAEIINRLRGGRLLLHLTDKPDTLAEYRTDQSLFLTVIGNRSPRRVDSAGEGCI